DWDEGPFYQSQRLALYHATAEKLLASGHAYYCFCGKEQLEARRELAAEEGRTPKYEGTCRCLSAGEIERRRGAGESAAVRFKVPQTGSTIVHDAVFGDVEFQNTELEDFVLLRSDGIPTYHLSVVADDLDMRMTHVIRGADHLSNTPKQILQYQALGAAQPVFAHVPLILGPDKMRLSKRHGATSVLAYKDMGIVPEAFRNFLAMLGWTPSGAAAGREIIANDELISLFGLDGISRSNAVFDNDKLAWFNTEYIRAYPAERLLPLVEEEWRRAGLVPARSDREWLLSTIDLLKPRARNLKDFAESFRGYFSDEFSYDPAAVEKFLKDASVREMLVQLAGKYESAPEFTEVSIEQVLREFAAEKSIKAGALINGSRVALTGQGVAPSLFAVMAALGRGRVVERLRRATQI
ncbi:MAG: glutamate--tRNA ligase, partial [Acidobacteriaceae bacterium]